MSFTPNIPGHRVYGNINLSGGTITTGSLSASTISATTIVSGTTPLQIIVQNIVSNSSTYVQPGSNVATGGTANAPTISLIASPSVTGIIASGTSTLQATTASSLSANTVSGTTYYSGNTTLANAILTLAGSCGEVNTASNVNGGPSSTSSLATVFKQKNSVDLEFRTLSAGTNITLITGDTITIQATGSGSSTLVQPGLNTYTGGTSSSPTVNVSGATLQFFSATSTANIGYNIVYSGGSRIVEEASRLYLAPLSSQFDILNSSGSLFMSRFGISGIITTLDSGSPGAGASTQLKIQSGRGPLLLNGENSGDIVIDSGGITATTFTAMTISGGTLYSGATNLSTTIINVAAATGDFTRVQGSNFITTGGTANAPTINLAQNFSGATISGGTLYSGATNLSTTIISIANAAASIVDTAVQAGSNIATGGTANAPTISVIASPSLNALTLSGAGQFAGVTSTGLSANTLSGGTLYSGATNLSTTIISIANAAASAVDTAVQAGSNIATGGTVNAPTISVVASPSLNGLTLSGAGQFAGVTSTGLSATTVSATTLFSGATNLSTTIINVAAATGDFTRVQGSNFITTGGTANAPTINLAQNFSGATVSGGTLYSGATNLSTTIISIANAAASIVDTAVQAGSNIATGGTANAPTISVIASPSLNALTLSGAGQFAGVTSTGLSANTLSGGTLYSGATNLSTTIISIANAAASAVDTAVQAGSNIATGGTVNAPTISVVASPSLNGLTLSGAGQFAGVTSTGLSANTLSGGTLYSGATNLSTTIINVAAATGDFTRVQGSNFITTGGTANAPIINLAQNFSGATISGGTLYSGATNLSTTIISIANAAASAVDTAVQAGSNIATGGTAAAPTISVVASPSLNALTLSGAGQFAGVTSTGLSANTLSGGTIYSGATNLSTTIINIANAAAASSGDITRVQPGSNITTGGTANAPTINVVASPSFNGLTLSGAGQFARVTSTGLSATTVSASTLFSGTTELGSIFNSYFPSLPPNQIAFGNSASAITSSPALIFSLSNSLLNINGGLFLGNITGSAYGIQGATLNTVIYNYNSTAKITLSNGLITHSVGESNFLGAIKSNSLTANTISGGTYFSGSTPLETIISNLAGGGTSTLVQPGSNIITGGTSSAPIVSVIASPSLNALILSGDGQFAAVTSTSLSATTLSGGTIFSGATNLYSIFARPEFVVNSVNAGSNITTGGTANSPTISVAASPSLNALTLSGAGQFAGVTSTGLSANTLSGGTLYSGATNLSTTIINVASATGDFTRVQGSNFITTGGTANAPTINLAQNFSGATISGGTLYSGATNLSTTIISIANAAASAVDIAVQAGSNIATGGTAAAPIISVVASPSLNALTLSGAGQFAGVTSTGLSANTLSGGTLYSGATNLYSIFATIGSGGSSTAVQAGSNITTGGTQTAPIISVAASPSLNALTLSGAGQFAEVTATSLSALTISGGTLYSGSTNLYNIFATSASGEANSGENIGGTSTTVATTAGIFKQKTGVLLEMRMLSAGTNISFITGDTITIQASGSGSATYVQPGLNTYTGGTSSAPTINISAATLVSLSANTITGTTIWGNGSNLTGVAHAFTGQTSISFSGFSGGETSYATTGVTNSNINSASTVMIRVIPSANHPNVEESMVENLTFTQTDIVDGVSFVINANADGGTWGVYNLVYRIIN